MENLNEKLKNYITKWEIIRGMFVKASFVDDILKMRLKIASKIEELANYEETIADYILKNINDNWNGANDDKIVGYCKCKNLMDELSEVLFLDLN